jgi:hypothetical protein
MAAVRPISVTLSSTRPSAKAKELSKWSIVFGVFLVVVLSLARGFWPLVVPGVAFGMSQVDIILLGLFCIGAWSPVYLSLWFDKFLGPKSGGPCGPENA